MVVRQLIVPLGINAGYLEARRLVRGEGVGELPSNVSRYLEARGLVAIESTGELPSNVLHDDTLLGPTDAEFRGMLRDYYALYAWTNQFVVHPEKGGRFVKGIDVVDTQVPCILAASSVPEEAIGREKVALFVPPGLIVVESDRVVIEADPKLVVVVTPFMQIQGYGRVDPATRLPLETDGRALEGLQPSYLRYTHRTPGIGVRPAARYNAGMHQGRAVFVDVDPARQCGVARVLIIEERT